MLSVKNSTGEFHLSKVEEIHYQIEEFKYHLENARKSLREMANDFKLAKNHFLQASEELNKKI